MGLIKVWASAYPGAIDDPTSMPTLTDLIDDVIASHPNALRDSVIALERENTGYKDNNVVTATTFALEDQLDVEQVVGSALFDGGDLANLIAHLRIVGVYNLNGGASQGALSLRLYDMGPPGSPLLPPVLRSEASILAADDGNLSRGQTTLGVSASPGVDADEIFNTARLYEFRVILDGAPVGARGVIHWSGIALGVTQ